MTRSHAKIFTGPRITGGRGSSKQDYRTPEEFIKACSQRFSAIRFDLAAVAENAQSQNYFAPSEILEVMGKGNDREIIHHSHHDPDSYGHDAFKHSWAVLSRKFCVPTSKAPGVLWLNPPFDDIERWARRCVLEMRDGANILFLTPASVGSNWFRDVVAPNADVYLLNGRMSFDGKDLYPKDCMLSHFNPTKKRNPNNIFVWDWRKDKIAHTWSINR